MSTQLVTAALLALAVAAGGWRPVARRWPLFALQAAAAALLFLTLFPPTTRKVFSADELIVLTPGITASQLASLPSTAAAVALPGGEAPSGIERVPDLGTALRRHSGLRRLRIVGGGLPARDSDAARGRVTAFDAAPLPRGLAALDLPSSVPAGHVWHLSGRAVELKDGRVELRDPSGAVAASQELDEAGWFTLSATARGEGLAMFSLSLFDCDGTRVDGAVVPLAVHVGTPLSILLLAGAPDAELKYLRRWAVDAGLRLDSRITLTQGVALTEGNATFDAGALRAADVAILDERSWDSLEARQKTMLRDAVRDGLGLLLRVTGPVPARVAKDWEEWGMGVRPVDTTASIRLDRALGLDESGLALTLHAVEPMTAGAAPLLRADDGTPLGWIRNAGQGRFALWRLADASSLSLSGAGAAFGSLWSEVLAAVSRARGGQPPTLPSSIRVDERAVICGLAADAMIGCEGEEPVRLVSSNGDGCAAFWPTISGWHTLSSGGAQWPLYVRDRDESPALIAGESRRRTQDLLVAATPESASSELMLPLPRWPFFLAFLSAVTALWLLERRFSAATVHDSAIPRT